MDFKNSIVIYTIKNTNRYNKLYFLEKRCTTSAVCAIP